jgi:Cu(I)/Ag(I) efflux system membrane fusion protein
MRPILLIAFAVPALVAACDEGRTGKSAQKYTCAMHRSLISDRAGDCPICGMKLVPIDATHSAISTATAAEPKKPLLYRNPMNPADTSPVPKKDPMGMDYVPVYPEDIQSAGKGAAGLATVHIDPERRRLIGLKTVGVRRAEIAGAIRTVGRVAMDETRVVKVQPRFEGFIERLEADFTGKYVNKGQRLASIYSPELLAAQQELLLAARGRQALAASGLPGAEEAARARLGLLGIGDSQIDQILRTGKPLRTLDVVAPISGYVTTKNAIAGARVAMDQPLFEIVDLSTVWLLADVYESELPRLASGQSATATLAFWPGKVWKGRVSYLYPTVDEKTRTIKVRIDLPNPRTELRPEMFADVVIRGTPRRALVIPEDALIDTGTRKVAFVDLGAGRLEPREVEVGEHAEGAYEVRAGLTEGEQVATGASFLLDSESHLKAAVAAMGAAPAATGRDGGQP